MGGHVERKGEMRTAYKNFVAISERQKPHGNLTVGGNIRMDLRQIVWETVSWSHLG